MPSLNGGSKTDKGEISLDLIIEEKLKRIKELFFLAEHPLCSENLLSKGTDYDYKITNDVFHKQDIDYSILPGIQNQAELLKSVANLVDQSLYRPSDKPHESSEVSNPKKRKASENESTTANDDNKSMKSAPLIQPLSTSAVSKTIAESVDGETKHLLEHDLKDLDVLSVPQHYPTKPHEVSPLAELYYLTQTLPLIKLLPGSHKSLSTENFEQALLEGKIAVLYSRIEELKRQGKWSLRQPIKYNDPFVMKENKQSRFHWDYTLQEAKWMSVDFKETKKYKKACCVTMAQAVQDYWTHGKDATCIKRKEIVHLSDDKMEDIIEESTKDKEKENDDNEDKVSSLPQEDSTPSVPGDQNTNDDTIVKQEDIKDKEPEEPASVDVGLLFSKPDDKVDEQQVIEEAQADIPRIPAKMEDKTSMFKLHLDLNDLKKIDQSIVKNLPKFTAFDDVDEDKPQLGSQPIKPNTNDIVSVSKLLYPFDDDDDGFHKIVLKEKSNNNKKTRRPTNETPTGLFQQSQRRFNYLKPPKPPLIRNIEYRSPTIWLPQDDKYLIHYVAEFCFNWELISEHLLSTIASMKRYESNIERRTPWQCFERYIQLNEKFQFSDMKGGYSYHAQQWLEQAHRAQLTTKRRISPLGVGNESIQRGHRRLRWASMFDAMRKCMKKRENQAAKMNSRRTTDYTQHLSGNKANDRIPTPSELSRLKFDRDKSIQEAYLNQQATRNRMMAAVANQQKQNMNRPNAGSPAPQPPVNRSGVPATSPPGQQQRLVPGAMPPSNNVNPGTTGGGSGSGSGGSPVMSGPGMDQALGNKGTPYTPEQIQQLIKMQKQRKLMQQQRQGQSGSPIDPTMAGNGNMVNANPGGDLKPNNGGGGQSPNQQQIQPQITQGQQQVQQQVQPTNAGGSNKPRIQFAPAQVSAIINSIQTKNPNLSKEQVTKLAATYLANLQQQQQSKMNQNRAQANSNQNVGNGIGGGVGGGGSSIGSSSMAPRTQQKQPQIATLTPQERNQLEMLKAAKTAQQHHLQQQQQQQQQQQRQQPQQPQQQKSNSGSPLMGSPQMGANNLSKLDYEQRKRLLIQKHQQQQLQNNQQLHQNGSGSGSGWSSSSGGNSSA